MKHPRTAPIEGMDMNNQQAIIVTREICVTTVSPAMTLGPVLIPRIPLIPRDTNMPFILERRLFPICSAFPVAINKRRDRHLDRSYLYSLKPLFLPRQTLHHSLRIYPLDSLRAVFENKILT